MTPKQNLAVLNNHIDNQIKGSCGPNGDYHKWGINEINDMINRIAALTNTLTEYEKLQEKQKKLQSQNEIGSSEKVRPQQEV